MHKLMEAEFRKVSIIHFKKRCGLTHFQNTEN
jgi:hypothetical protein